MQESCIVPCFVLISVFLLCLYLKYGINNGTIYDLKFWLNCRVIYGRERKLNASWFKEHPWLRYSISTFALNYGSCTVFADKGAKDKLFINPVTGWVKVSRVWYSSRKIRIVSCREVAAEHFKNVKSGKTESVISTFSSSKKEQVLRNRHILDKIIRALLLCGKQNIAIRDHTEERSNFMAILREFAEDDPLLKEHIQSTTARYKYTSPEVQNDLLIMCRKLIFDKIVEDCNEACFFSVLGDECMDKSTKEQMSICLRFIDPGTKDVGNIFFFFVEPDNTKGETITRCL
ncbi:unnamed protein product [Mytilus edulis]|uniref:DUF4371 domain-containing protein n=1 Tax=Mytilus edulis TaxID=6550 RepID=A0A8S3SIA6_MYTED|nr:unnamed protein product [Mytilus edulis]